MIAFEKTATPPLVLLAEDERFMRMRMRSALEHSGFRVEEAENGPEIISAFVRLRPDIVVLNKVMPETNGYAACRAIRQLPAGQSVPVLMVTGQQDVEAIRNAYESGATDFVTTPINWEMLGYRLRYMLRAGETVEKLQRDKALLEKTHHLAKLVHWEFNPKTLRFSFQAEMRSFLNLDHSQHEVPLADLVRHVFPEDRNRLKEVLRLGTNHNRPFFAKFRFVLPNGTRKLLYIRGEVEIDEDRNCMALIGILQDITEMS